MSAAHNEKNTIQTDGSRFEDQSIVLYCLQGEICRYIAEYVEFGGRTFNLVVRYDCQRQPDLRSSHTEHVA